MAEETQKPDQSASTPEVVVELDVTPPEKPVPEIETPPPPPPPPSLSEDPEKPAAAEEEKILSPDEIEKIAQSVSFKEESNVVGELPDPQKKALDELKLLIREALDKHVFTAPPPPPPAKEEEKQPETVDVKTEEKVEEVAPVVAVEEPLVVEKVEEKVEVCEGAAVEEPPKVESETVVVVEAAVVAKEVPETVSAPPVAEVVTETVEKVDVVDDDGAKTVEAIAETVVQVSPPPPEEPCTEKEAEAAAVEQKEEAEAPAVPPPPPEEVFIWGIPLLGDERSDVILLKFLRARDFKVKDAFTMLKNTVRWRKEFGIEALLEEDFGTEWDKVVFSHGFDKEGHPVCYNVFGEFDKKELYQNTFGDEAKRTRFLRWRIQFLEKSIRNLDFCPNGVNTIVQVNDLKNSPGLLKWELRAVTRQALQLLQDNYPEFVAKQVFINVPWWYLAVNRMISPFLTQRTKSKFVFAGPSKSAETLFKYKAPELVPLQYGGLSREGEQEFSVTDSVTEVIIKPASTYAVEIPVSEKCHLVWETRVIGWEVSYGAEFVPSDEGGYTLIIQKSRKFAITDEPAIVNSFRIGDPGKVVLNIDNQSSKKKKLLYRFKTKPVSD